MHTDMNCITYPVGKRKQSPDSPTTRNLNEYTRHNGIESKFVGDSCIHVWENP